MFTITLNSFSGTLPVSPSFIWSYRFLPCLRTYFFFSPHFCLTCYVCDLFSSSCMLPKRLLKLDMSHLWSTCPFRCAVDAWFTKVIVQFNPWLVQLHREISVSLPWLHGPWAFCFGFDPTYVCGPPSGICYLPKQEAVEAVTDWGRLDHLCGKGKRW